MQFVGIGFVHPVIMLLMIFAVLAFYGFYLWGLSRLLAKAMFPRQYLVYVVIFDILLVIAGFQTWVWYQLWLPPIPKSAFVVLMIFAFVRWPNATEVDNVAMTR